MVALRVAATPERAFAVFTGEIGRWWQASPLFPLGDGVPGVLAFEAGPGSEPGDEPGEGGRLTETRADGTVFEIGRITCWEPGRRLHFIWRQGCFAPDQWTEVVVRFEAVGAETRVSVEHRGWDRFPIDHAARHRMPEPLFLRRNAEWWQRLLARFRERLSGAAGDRIST